MGAVCVWCSSTLTGPALLSSHFGNSHYLFVCTVMSSCSATCSPLILAASSTLYPKQAVIRPHWPLLKWTLSRHTYCRLERQRYSPVNSSTAKLVFTANAADTQKHYRVLAVLGQYLGCRKSEQANKKGNCS